MCGASVVAQVAKNPPVVRETWVQSLGWEDPLEEEMGTHSSILAWRIPMTEKPVKVQGITKRLSQLNDFHSVTHSPLCGREGLSVPATSQRGTLNLNMEAWATLGSSLHGRNCNNLRFLVSSTSNP